MGTYGTATGVVIRRTSAGGQILGLDAGNLQAYFDSDGSIKAGAGAVELDSSGITATAGTIGGWTLASGVMTGTHARLDATSGYVSFGGVTTPPTSFADTRGIFIGYGSDSAGKMSIWDTSSNYLQWDGFNLTWNSNAGKCSLDDAGNFTATSATITGSVTATTGAIGGWTIDSSKIYNTNAYLASAGYISFGASPPTAYGSNVGVWLGYSSGAKMSLYSSATNYFQWDGSKVLMSTTSSYFVIGTDGKITNTGGTIGGWTISTTQIYSGTGSGSDDVILDSSNKYLKLGTSLIDGDSYGINLYPMSTGTVTITGTPTGAGHLYVNGNVTINTNGELIHKGTKIGFFNHTTNSQQGHVNDAKTTYTATELDTESEIISAFNSTNTTINAILSRLENYGLFASS